MHIIHHTEAIVLGGYDRGEASRGLALFTRAFGLVHAHAQGLRELRSKLRYALQDFSRAETHLVRGKQGWRITSAEHLTAFVPQDENAALRLRVATRVAKLLRRLLSGEEKNEKLYDEIAQAFSFLKTAPLGREYIFNIEVILVMRILAHLGYWGDDERFTPFLGSNITEGGLLQQINKVKPFAIREINKALTETQL
ncbi:MAG: recombination protein O N-terminal domain-containing protein [Parcubacteria group bacterium]|nr:recombination protein O N-terminal domain-containing protein [Parcubacteria group bacterium]